jgi:hypothetical protein
MTAHCLSALSRGLGEKRLVLRHNFRALTIWTLNRFFLVLADRHREGETLVTLFAKIFVYRHIGRSGLINQIYMNAADSGKTYLLRLATTGCCRSPGNCGLSGLS